MDQGARAGFHVNKVVVGILAGYGDSNEFIRVWNRVANDPNVKYAFPLFGVRPKRWNRGHYEFLPLSVQPHRGQARTQLLVHAASFSPDILVMLDDDTLPEPCYFEQLASLSPPCEPTLMGGRLVNYDGHRHWDVCSFQDGHPCLVPYNQLNNTLWVKDLYLSGPQHIFNRAGWVLAVQTGGYPKMQTGEDTFFSWKFRQLGGKVLFVPQLMCQLLHQHMTAVWPTAI